MARVALCQDVMMEYMGLMSISAVLKEAGHSVEVFIECETDGNRLLQEVTAFRPDIVGFSILTPTVPWALRMAQRVKETTGAVTIFGNVHAIMNPDIIENPGVDIVCHGEGELPMTELARRLDNKEPFTHLESCWVKTENGIIKNPHPSALLDINKLPLHDLELYDKYPRFLKSGHLRIAAGRGCPFCCAFCANAVLSKHFGRGYVRKRPPEAVIQEIELRIRRRPVKIKEVYFTDEVLWLDNRWLREFLTLYRDRIGLPFKANFRFGGITTEDDIRLMAEAGAKSMGVSAETGSYAQRRDMMNKHVRDEEYLRVGRLLRKYKIEYVSGAFFGLPGDTVQDHVDRLPFYRALKPTYLWTTFFQPYPGIPMTELPEVQKYLPADREFDSTFHHDMHLDLPDRQRLANLKRVYYLCMIFPRLTPLLVWLTKFRLPLLFNVLFMTHFAFYVYKFGGVSFGQYLSHIRLFGINPLLRKLRRRRNKRWRPAPLSVGDTAPETAPAMTG